MRLAGYVTEEAALLDDGTHSFSIVIGTPHGFPGPELTVSCLVVDATLGAMVTELTCGDEVRLHGTLIAQRGRQLWLSVSAVEPAGREPAQHVGLAPADGWGMETINGYRILRIGNAAEVWAPDGRRIGQAVGKEALARLLAEG